MEMQQNMKIPYQTGVKGFHLRIAEEPDTTLIISLIKELANYEKMLDEVVATEELIRENLFHKKYAEAVIGEYYGQPCGFALFFHSFSTFLSKPGIYLEDLFIRPEMRGKGFGREMLTFLARLAKDRCCGRLEWNCLDWNEPSIKFYKSMGAKPLDDRTVYRVSGEALDKLAGKIK